MIEAAFEGKIDSDTINEIWPEYNNIKDFLYDYEGTNIEHANLLMHQILNPNEKNCLEEALFGNHGWYKRINGDGMIKIKLAAMSLGLTNNIFTFDSEMEKKIVQRIKEYTEEEQMRMMSCYVKQKLTTYLTLKNYLKNIRKTTADTLVLYRGINTEYNNEQYMFAGMEAWTMNLDMAYRFARNDGYVIEKEYKISQIFAGRKSTFKNKPYGLYEHNGFFVRREHEMIVENPERVYDKMDPCNIRLAIDNDVF